MAPIKFEENIREKLQERELQPSDGAWEKLESQLGDSPKQSRPTYFWMAIAASFIGVLVIGSWMFLRTSANTEQLVEENTQKEQEETPFLEVKEDQVIAPMSDEMEERLSVSEETPEDSSELLMNSEEITNPTSNEGAIASVDPAQEKKEKETVQEKALENKVGEAMASVVVKQEEKVQVAKTDGEEAFIQQKVDQVIEEVKKIQEMNSAVSAEEIDALLAKAQRDIATKRILNSSHQKVDAQALLMDVEIELERSFRDRVFDALGEGFNKVRTAVAERNN